MPRGQGIFDGSSGMTYPKAGDIVRRRLKENVSVETIAKDDFKVSKQALLKYLKGFEQAAADLGSEFPSTEKIKEKAKELKLTLSDNNFRIAATVLINEAAEKKDSIKADDLVKMVTYATEWSLFVRDNVTISADDVMTRGYNDIMSQIAAIKAKLAAK